MRRLILAVFLLLALTSLAKAQDVPTASVIRERIRAAQGAAPGSERLVVISDARGMHDRLTTYRKGDDYREVDEEGPFLTQSGMNAKQRWHQNDNGETVLDQPDPGLAKPEIYGTTVTPIATPVVGFLLSSLNASLDGTKEYVDSATWRVVRIDRVRPNGTTITSYDDFRTVDGATRAWHWTVRDGHAENDADYRIESGGHDVDAKDVAIAPPRRELVEFPAGKQSVTLPVRFDGDKFYVRLKVGDRGLDFLLDTGASGITIDSDVARQLGLTVYGRYSNGENAGRYESGRVLVPDVTVGDLAMHRVAMSLIPHVGFDPSDVRAVGLLGFDFIGALALKLDYEHGTVTASDPSAFVAPGAAHTVALDIRLRSQQPMTDVTINNALGERFLIDTGASAPVMIQDYFRRRHPEALVDLGGGGNDRLRRYVGVGGAFETQPVQLESVRVGNVNFSRFLAYVVRSKAAYSADEDGVVGTDFLRFFNVYLDYAESRIYLEPNTLGRAASGR